MSSADLKRRAVDTLPALPRDRDGPVFAAPWQAQAFAMTVELCETGVLEWQEWAAALGVEINAAQAAGDPDLGDTYYEHWLRALEKLVVDKQLFSTSKLLQRRDAWKRASAATPHGEPIELARAAAAEEDQHEHSLCQSAR
ncbi:MAG: nitrile hydratase accessory protein [Salinisphaera sp.]|jgi:nitrile hydratase accessory protein|nr:nitrile hydratase accessory protein [Salinisphaera sp.]